MRQTLDRSHIDTPLGAMVIVTSARGLCVLEFAEQDRIALFSRRLAGRYPGSEIRDHHSAVSRLAARWIQEYFARRFAALPPITAELQLDFIGTDLELDVWRALIAIPIGALAAYGQIAQSIGRRIGAARAVGGAVGRNPFSILVPCHRVVGADGTMTGYGGGIDRKQWLLGHEGVRVRGKRGSSTAVVS